MTEFIELKLSDFNEVLRFAYVGGLSADFMISVDKKLVDRDVKRLKDKKDLIKAVKALKDNKKVGR